MVSRSPQVCDERPVDEFETLLADYPGARVSAVTGDGTPVPVPAEVPLGDDHVLSGTAGMKAYLPQDRPTLIDVFDRTLHTGHAWGNVRLLHDPGVTLTVHMFDTRERYGVMLAVAVPAIGQVIDSQTVRPDQPAVRSRLARVYKSRTAEILGIDRATTDILGWASDQMVGKRSLEFIHPDDQGLAIESWAVVVTEPDANRRVRIRHRSSVGTWIWFDVAHSASVWQGQECFVADMIDISQEMRTQQALEAREQLLAQLAQALPLGVFQIDEDHHFLYTNDCLFHMMGTTRAPDFNALLESVVAEDRNALRVALALVMSDGGDSQLNVHVEPANEPARVCQFTLRRLASTVTAQSGAVGCVVDITEQTVMRRELEDRATFDPLTRCYNRATIMTLLDRALTAEPPNDAPSPTAVLFIDLDRFKEINDRHGHHVGDEYLTAMARRIRGSLRANAALGRLGGDEFLVVLPNIQTEHEALTIAQRIADTLRQPIALSIGIQTPSASVGLAIQSPHPTTAETLVNQADTAMYQAKTHRDGRVAIAR